MGLRNDAAWAADPAHSDDNRWMHRPPMDSEAAERRHDPATALVLANFTAAAEPLHLAPYQHIWVLD